MIKTLRITYTTAAAAHIHKVEEEEEEEEEDGWNLWRESCKRKPLRSILFLPCALHRFFSSLFPKKEKEEGSFIRNFLTIFLSAEIKVYDAYSPC